MGARSVFHSAAHAECQAFTLLFLCWLQGCHGGRPVTLIGCSMGARLVFHCLLELARLGLRGCVENVILLGAPLSCRCGSGKGAIFGGHVLKGSDNGMAGPQGLCGERHTARGTPQLQVGREGGREDKGGSAYQLPCLQFLQKLRVDQLLCCMCSSTQYSLLHGSPGVQVQLIALQPVHMCPDVCLLAWVIFTPMTLCVWSAWTLSGLSCLTAAVLLAASGLLLSHVQFPCAVWSSSPRGSTQCMQSCAEGSDRRWIVPAGPCVDRPPHVMLLIVVFRIFCCCCCCAATQA